MKAETGGNKTTPMEPPIAGTTCARQMRERMKAEYDRCSFCHRYHRVVEGPCPTVLEDPEVLYFGCLDRPGHSFHTRSLKDRPAYHETPWGDGLDTGILKLAGLPDNLDGRYVVSRRGGWTALNFWDRSGDSRPGSHSVFLVREEMHGPALLQFAAAQWPQIFGRLKFKLQHFTTIEEEG